MSSRLARLPRAGTLASVFLLAAVHPPIEWTPLVWVALVPWLTVVRRASCGSDAVLQAMWLQVLVGLAWGFWLPEAVAGFFGIPLAAGVVALAANAMIHHLHLLPFAYCVHAAERAATTPVRRALALLLLPTAYCGADWLLPGIFQHGIGAALHDLSRLRQLAGLGGVPLLTWLVVFANVALAAGVEAAFEHEAPVRERARRAALPLALLATAVAGALVHGEHRYAELTRASETAPRVVHVALVQGNVGGDLKRRWRRGDAEAAGQALRLYIRESQRLLSSRPRPDLVVWPETAYPGLYRRPENEDQARLNAAFDRFVHDMKVPFVFGAYDREERLDRRILRNSLFIVEPRPDQRPTELSPARAHAKSILFPLGETLPFVSDSFAHALLRPSAHFSRGSGPAVYPVGVPTGGPPTTIGPLICYEDLFLEHSAALARLGAELLVNVSNDGWFGDLGEPRLHLIYARLRSVELGLPQVRATNTGYSAVILPSGDLIFESGFDERVGAVVPTPISGSRKDSLVARWGSEFGFACLLIAGIGFGALLGWKES